MCRCSLRFCLTFKDQDGISQFRDFSGLRSYRCGERERVVSCLEGGFPSKALRIGLGGHFR